ncbi:MAG: 3-methyl-2-oxobutanoate hydroxymethyltransferase [Gaiellaceae bacterium]|jgi:3-methyl-2-oxobutanoate hydroxymethyltransferase|nr:3-methyl-2-oxobutanoate hydroxymethyltransferase [Gaiellaceae bacterium]
MEGEKVTLPALQAMKRAGQKIVGVVAWDFQTARILDRAGVDIVSVGDSVGVNLWGRVDESDVTLDELVLVCAAVKRGIRRALVSCDLPHGQGLEAARRLVREGGADVVKVEDADAVPTYVDAGVPVFAQFSGGPGAGDGAVALARRLEAAGASLLDFRHSGPVDGPKVVAAVSIPVIGGLGGGPWLDGRMRLIHRAVGAAAEALDEPPDSYANVAQVTYDAVAAYADDVRGGRQVRGG